MAVLTHEGNVIGKSSANDGVLTIQKNNVTLDTFSANSSSNKTVNIEVPTKLSDLTDDVVSGNYLKLSDDSAQTVENTDGSTTALSVKANSDQQMTHISFKAGDGTEYGKIGVTSGNNPIFTSNNLNYKLFCNRDGYTWQLAAGTPITATADAHADLNDFNSTGTYYLSNDTANYVDNKPIDVTHGFTLIVQSIRNAANTLRQIYIRWGDNATYVRSRINSGWQAWSYTVMSTNSTAPTIANTSTAQYVVTFLKSNATNGRAVVGFVDKNDAALGYLGVNENKKPIFLAANSTDKEIALADNTPIEVPMFYAATSDTLPSVIIGWLQYICKNYPGKTYRTFVGTISYNGAYRVSAIIYNTDTHDTNYTPQYGWGEMQLMTTMYIFSCNSYAVTTKQVQMMS